MRILKFKKEHDNRWYIDLPSWPGSHSALEMVAGADTLLDTLSEGSATVSLEVSTKEVDGFQLLKRVRFKDRGAAYTHNGTPVWLCAVTIFVFGYFPKEIYFKVIKT